MSDVLLVRHAEPRAVSERRFDDASGLSKRGRAQARALGRRLVDSPLRGCLVSPLARARETAELILEGRDVPLAELDVLAEGALGELEGLTREEAENRFPDVFRFGLTTGARLAACGSTAPGGESRADFLGRAGRAAQRVRDELAVEGEPLLVVSHGGLLNALLQHLLSREDQRDVPFGFAFCGAVRVIAYHEGEAKAEGYGPFPMIVFSSGGAE